jgi:adenylyl-sulfate kinase
MSLPKVIWFTGLSGAGKSTLAERLSLVLQDKNLRVSLLDGDQLRQKDHNLGFSDADRTKHIERVIELAKAQHDQDYFVIVALISPFRATRKLAKDRIGEKSFIEVYVNTPLHVCEKRDTKGLYKKARAGLIKHMTGIDSQYEVPDNPDITIDTSNQVIDECVLKILKFIN